MAAPVADPTTVVAVAAAVVSAIAIIVFAQSAILIVTPVVVEWRIALPVVLRVK